MADRPNFNLKNRALVFVFARLFILFLPLTLAPTVMNAIFGSGVILESFKLIFRLDVFRLFLELPIGDGLSKIVDFFLEQFIVVFFV